MSTKRLSLKERIHKGDLVVGSWITLAHPAIAEIMCRAGFEWLTVDLEHSVITIREAEELIRVIELSGASPFVRLSENDPTLIKRVMDAGATGIIVPMVNSREDAEKAASAMYYPPMGTRGVGLARAQKYGTGFSAYVENQKENILVVQIEHIKAVQNLESILSLETVDAFIVGPYDLSGSMGLVGQFDHPEFVKTLKYIQEVAQKLKKPAGIHIIEPETSQLQTRIAEGYRFIAYSLDFRMLDATCRIGLKGVK